MKDRVEDREVHVMADPGTATLPEKVFNAELENIRIRREFMSLPPVGDGNGQPKGQGEWPTVSLGLSGIALSGGGIRSSTFNLGVLQALDGIDLLKRFDYLSTVSGGGYIGSCLSSVFTGAAASYEVQMTKAPGTNSEDEATGADQDDEVAGAEQAGEAGGKAVQMLPFPFRHEPGKRESGAFRHLRSYASYLTPDRPFAMLRLPGLFIRGLLINSVIVLPLLLFFAATTILICKDEIVQALNTRRFTYTILERGRQDRQERQRSYNAVTIDLSSSISWNAEGRLKYIILEGLPRNSYSEKGVFMEKGKWLFHGSTAEKLVLRMLVPPMEMDHRIEVKAWQTNVAVFGKAVLNGDGSAAPGEKDTTAPEGSQPFALCVSPLKGGGIRVSRQAFREVVDFFDRAMDGRQEAVTCDQSAENFGNVSEGELIFTIEDRRLTVILSKERGKRIIAEEDRDSVDLSENWRDVQARKFLAISNLPDNHGSDEGYRLNETTRVLKTNRVNAIGGKTIELLRIPAAGVLSGRSLWIRAWQSEDTSRVMDPISTLFHWRFDLTLWTGGIFIAMMALFPVVIKGMKIFRLSAWQERDYLTRYLCGGGIAVIAAMAVFESQPLAIYCLYWLEHSWQPPALFGDMDNFMVVMGGLLTAIGGIFSSNILSRGAGLLSKMSVYLVGIMGPLTLWCVYLNFCGEGMVSEKRMLIPAFVSDQQIPYWYFAMAVLLYCLTRLFYDVNKTSLHPFYRDRLSKAFLFNTDENDDRKAHNDDQKLSTLDNTIAPYHLINTTLNVPGTHEESLRGREAEFFVFSREYVGSQLTGYCRTTAYERSDPTMGLATAMAISAAAAAPNMGRVTQPTLTFIMALLNIRLGYWAKNPLRFDPEYGQDIWRKLGRLFYGFKVGPTYLIMEMLGKINAQSSNINLSDGGHLENMGLFELVRRRCKFIIVCDAEADPKVTFMGFAEALRMIRIDMGIMVDIDLDPICRTQKGKGQGWKEKRQCRHFAFGTIHYSEEETGRLLYIKSSVSGDENVYIEDYMARNPTFPHETTADQFFDEAQFEAYRALGYHIGSAAFNCEEGRAFRKELGIEKDGLSGS